MRIVNTSKQKILVVTTKFLGDLIITTPGIKALRQKFPQAEIFVLVRSEYQAVLKNNPNINQIISFDFNIRQQNFFERLKYELSFWKKIRNEKFDVFISLQPGDRIAFLAWISGAKIRIAPRKQSFWFLFNKHINVFEDSISYLEYYNKIISAFTEEPVNYKTEFIISPEDDNWSSEFLKSNNVSQKDILISVHPGASEPTKIWPSKNFVALLQKFLKVKNTQILIIAGPGEEKLVNSITEIVNNNNVFPFYSKEINKTAALIKKCKLIITNDTGTRHLAVALKTPVIALMPEDNQNCWNFYDVSDKHFVIKGSRMKDESGKPFLGGIPVDNVYSKVKSILNL